MGTHCIMRLMQHTPLGASAICTHSSGHTLETLFADQVVLLHVQSQHNRASTGALAHKERTTMGGRAFNWGGGGVDQAPWLDPPQKGLN